MNDIRICRIVHISATLAGTVICAYFSIPAAVILFAVSALIFTVNEIYCTKRKNKIFLLCDDIDRILHGDNSVSFNDYTEGDLSILTAEIHKMTIRLREQNSALISEKQYLKESLEDIAHQLRTPLTSMIIILEMLRNPELSKRERMNNVHELYSLLSRMNWLIETMLGLSRIEAGAVEFQHQEINCRSLIADSLEPISVQLDLKNINVKTSIEGDPIFIGDRQYFTEALMNILKNCMEHTPENGQITISAGCNPIYTQIVVTDSGSGISEEDLPHIFERFYRSGHSCGSGFGIGLAFARKIAVSQNGSLQASNSPDGGALFDLRIYGGTA